MNTTRTPRNMRTGQTGSAMIMVLLILGVLLIISLPFLMSMTRHSVNARTYQAETRTGELARFGQQSATGILGSGQTEREWSRRREAPDMGDRKRTDLFNHPLFVTPYMDYSRELSLLRKQLARHYLFESFDEQRSLGIQMEDEQGKINVLTAPDGVIENLKTFLSPSDRVESYVTRHSVRPRVYTTSNIVSRYPDDDRPGTEIDWTRTPHPVNINTAHWKVLAAIFTGIGGDSDDDSDGEEDESVLTDTKMDRSTARDFAKFLAARTPLNDWYQFRHVLGEADEQDVISADEQKLIRMNAMQAGVLNSRNRYNINTTVPICFRSFDRYAIDTEATTLNPAGLQRSTSGSRRVRTATERSSSVVMDSGYEFARSMNAIRRGGGIRRKNGFGFVVGPTPMYAELSKTTLSFEPDEYGTWAKTEQMKDRASEAEIQPEPNDDGKHSPFGSSISTVEAPDDLLSGDNAYKSVSTGAGGIKFWVKFDGSPQSTTLFDVAQSTHSGRIHLYLKDGQLVLDVAGPTRDKKFVRIAGDWSPQQDTWYHIAAFWKGSKFGHLALMVDGHFIGETTLVDEDGKDLHKISSASLSENGSVSALSDLPDGYWQIGEEVIRLNMVQTESGEEQNTGGRALTAQATTPHEHPENSLVTPYGFSIHLGSGASHRRVFSPAYLDREVSMTADLSGIPEMDMETTAKFGNEEPAICPSEKVELVEPDDADEDPYYSCNAEEEWSLDPSTSNIPVMFDHPRNPEEVPSPALFIIHGRAMKEASGDNGNNGNGNQPPNDPGQDEEEIEYTVEREIVTCEEATETELVDCSRGLLGTEPQRWMENARVELLGFPVSGANSFPDENRIVQLDHEWIGPVKPITVDGQSFLGSAEKNIPLQRGVHRTAPDDDHEVETRITPVFDLEREDPESRYLAEGFDMEGVTLIDNEGNVRDRFEIQVSDFFITQRNGNTTSHSRAGLDRNVDTEVETGDLSRLLRFPSGELVPDTNGTPSPTFGSTHPNAEPMGSVSGTVANLETVDGSGAYRILDKPVEESSQVVVRGSGLSAPGAIMVGSTVFGYPETESDSREPDDPNNSSSGQTRTINQTILSEPTRKYLQDKREEPEYTPNRGDHVLELGDDRIEVGALERQVSASTNDVSVTGTADDGYVRIGDEILSLNNGQMPMHPVVNRGMFRGSFGTTPAAHSQNTLVFKMPWRYPDRVPEADVNRLFSSMTFHVIERNRPDATWTGINWDVDVGSQQSDRGSFPRVLVRTDRDTPWHKVERRYDMRTTSSIDFEQPIASDRIELLFLFDYEDGAYNDQNWRTTHGWKTTTRLERIELNYRTPARTYMYRDQK